MDGNNESTNKKDSSGESSAVKYTSKSVDQNTFSGNEGQPYDNPNVFRSRFWGAFAGLIERIASFSLSDIVDALTKLGGLMKKNVFFYFSLIFWGTFLYLITEYSGYEPSPQTFLSAVAVAFLVVGALALWLLISVRLFDGHIKPKTTYTFLSLLQGMKQQRGDFFFYIVLLGFSLVSFISTSFGLTQIMGQGTVALDKTSEEFSGYSSVISYVPYILAVVVQLSIYLVVSRIASDKNYLKKFAYIILYLMAMIFSSGFGYGFWYDTLYSEKAYEKNFNEITASFSNSIIQNRNSLNEAINIVTMVKGVTQDSFKRESEDGYMCHAMVGEGEGERYIFLRESEEVINSLAIIMESSLSKLYTEQEISERVASLRNIDPKQAIQDLKLFSEEINQNYSVVEGHIANFKEKFMGLVEKGQGPLDNFSAPFPDELCPLDAKRTYVRLVENLPDSLVIDIGGYGLIDYTDKKEVLIEAFNQFVSIGYDILTLEVYEQIKFGGKSALKEIVSTILPFLFNVFIDVMIFIFAFILGRKSIIDDYGKQREERKKKEKDWEASLD